MDPGAELARRNRPSRDMQSTAENICRHLRTSKVAIERIAFTMITERVRFEHSLSLKFGNRNGDGEVIEVLIGTHGFLSDYVYKADQFFTVVLIEMLHQAVTYSHQFVHVWVEFHGATVSFHAWHDAG